MPNFFSFSASVLAFAALIAGALVPFQAGSNATLGQALGHPLWATVASLLISMVVVVPIILAMRVPTPSIQQAANLPFWAWFGGIAGVIFITSALLLTPRLGATSFIVCVIAGQMLTSLLIDHFGLVGLPIKEVNLGRVAGIVLVLVGTLIVQWSTPSFTDLGTHKAHKTTLKNNTVTHRSYEVINE